MNRVKKIFFGGLLFLPLLLSAQNKDIKAKFEKYTTDSIYKIKNGQIVVTRIIEGIDGNKDDIYLKVLNFFTQNSDASFIIQINDKEDGLFIMKGLFKEFWTSKLFLVTLDWNCWHIFRTDIKDGRARVTCSFSNMQTKYYEPNQYRNISDEYNIADYAPFTDKIKDRVKYDKGKQTEAFVHLIETVQNTFDSLEKTLKEEAIKGVNDNW